MLRTKHPLFHTPPMLLYSTHHPCSLRILASGQKGSFKSILLILAKKQCVDCTLGYFKISGLRRETLIQLLITLNLTYLLVVFMSAFVRCLCRLSWKLVVFLKGVPVIVWWTTTRRGCLSWVFATQDREKVGGGGRDPKKQEYFSSTFELEQTRRQ